jgi:hypothetical protein
MINPCNKKSMAAHFRAMLHRYTPGEKIPEPDATELAWLLSRHHQVEQKTGVGIAYFTVHTTPLYATRGFLIVRIDGTVADFSYLKCIANKPPSILSQVIQAMRAEVGEDIRQAKLAYFAQHADGNGRVPCAVSGNLVTIEEADADHAAPYHFHTLAITFLKARGIEPNAALITAPDDNQYHYRLIDPDLAKAWVAFHHELAAVRIVDRRVNTAIAHESRVKAKDRQLQLVSS